MRQYAEQFEKLVFETEFHGDIIISATFYNGLKYEVKRYLIGRRPDDLKELKALAIALDEELMAAQDHDRRDQKPKRRRQK